MLSSERTRCLPCAAHPALLPFGGVFMEFGSQDEQDREMAALMRAAQGGDSSAYGRLLHEVMPMLRRYVRRSRGFLDAADIEDLVQDVLMSLHAVRATYDPARPFLPWLFAIARNRMADGARRSMRRAAHEVQVEELPVTFADDEANKETNRLGEDDALRSAIAALPPGQRTAVELLKLKEMSLKEAAHASGMSVGALKVAMHRAMTSLEKAMARG